jgi:hypothetical protein
MTRKKLLFLVWCVRLVGWTGLALWLFAMAMYVAYADSRPHAPQPEIGRTYPLNNHGTIGYLTKEEYWRIWGIACTGMGLLLIVIPVGRRLEKRLRLR